MVRFGFVIRMVVLVLIHVPEYIIVLGLLAMALAHKMLALGMYVALFHVDWMCAQEMLV